MLAEIYEGDSVVLRINLEGHNLPPNTDLSFVIDIGDGKVIKKKIGTDGVVKIAEKETLGLDGTYLCEIRLNNSGMTKVLYQDLIKIADSITVDGVPIASEETGNTTGGGTVDDCVADIEPISDEDIERLF